MQCSHTNVCGIARAAEEAAWVTAEGGECMSGGEHHSLANTAAGSLQKVQVGEGDR